MRLLRFRVCFKKQPRTLLLAVSPFVTALEHLLPAPLMHAHDLEIANGILRARSMLIEADVYFFQLSLKTF